ncbi:hypothetical protein CUR178_01422 [Leishmania enriettii]|uniref:Uncharacterized protein n=1 Tax=Leishmania enriettii TaxID=5663 RepID=A0A836GRF4_LEIEN|nr:hypothetical protein CUR178_01422 [Leishmania enriettii]
MTFPGVAYGARKAELWLQCVLAPFTPIPVMCATEVQRAALSRRLSALSPGSRLHVFTVADLPDAPEFPTEISTRGGLATATDLPWREMECDVPARTVPAGVPLPRKLLWMQHGAALAT